MAVVFVHGIFGDTVGTWTADRRPSMFDLLHDNPAVGPKVDMFAFGYTSNMFAAGSLSIQEAANSLHGRLQLERILDYPAVVFVAHSMGGLVVLRELLTHREDLLPRVRGLVFYATPQEGSQITRIARHVANNPAIAEMLPGDQNLSLQQLDNEWKALPARPPVRCAYEKRPTRDVMVVQVMSATRFCDGTPVAIDADHLQIVKPDRPAHDSMMVLVNALNEFALGTELRAVLDTPDFVPERDYVVFTMTDPFGRSVARLNNTGGSALRYTIGPPSDGKLFVWPDDTPRTLPAGGRELLRFGLGFGATATEYRLTLTSDVSDRRVVVVRVPDLAAMMAQQVRLAEDVSRDLGALLASPSTGATLHGGGGRRRVGARGSHARRPGQRRPAHRRPARERGLGRDRRSHGRGQLARPGDPRLAARRAGVAGDGSGPRRAAAGRRGGGAVGRDARLRLGAHRRPFGTGCRSGCSR